jgi:phosphopantothenoylcysteine synthetase/decarboxylase
MRAIVTSGPTREYIDAVRYIGNTSSGRLGVAMAEELAGQGCEVFFIKGKGSETPRRNLSQIKIIEIETVKDLIEVLNKNSKKKFDIFVHAMAVLDYKPAKYLGRKKSSKDKIWNVALKKNPKVINRIKKIFPDIFLVGFKLEYNVSKQILIKQAGKLIKDSCVDLVVANDLKTTQNFKTHQAYFIDKEGKILDNVKGKDKIAKRVVRIIKNIRHKGTRAQRHKV